MGSVSPPTKGGLTRSLRLTNVDFRRGHTGKALVRGLSTAAPSWELIRSLFIYFFFHNIYLMIKEVKTAIRGSRKESCFFFF